MKNNLFLIFFLLCLSKNFAQRIIKRDFFSSHLNESKLLEIFIPKDYNLTNNRYPLTIILEADDIFDSYITTSELFEKKDRAPSQIIVGIPKKEQDLKIRDYGFDPLNSYPTHTAMDFFNYISLELIPFLKNEYRISNFSTIIGKGLSANFTNYFLFERAPIFNAYVNISPTYAEDMPEYLKTSASDLSKRNYFYYIAYSNGAEAEGKKLTNNVDIKLKTVENPYFKYKFEYFENSDDLTSIPQSIASAIDHVFSMYSKISKQEYNTNISFLSPLAAIEYLTYKYENIEHVYGIKKDIRIDDLIAIENLIIEKEEGIHLKKFGKKTLELFPKEPLGNYYLGLFHEKKENYRKAAILYKHGYSKIENNPELASRYFKNIERVSALQKMKNLNVVEQ